jgi:hypothetical protein
MRAGPADPGLDRRRRAVWGGAGPAGTVVQARVAFGPPAADPCVGCRTGDTHLRGHVRDRTAGQDTFDQDPSAVNGQPGITVGHEDLRAVKPRHLHHTEGLRHDQDSAPLATLRVNPLEANSILKRLVHTQP